MKLFLSYCHKDKEHLEDFNSHVSPLREAGLISDIWFDRQINAGGDINQIDTHIKNSNIVVCFVSANYLASKSCQNEIDEAFRLRETENVEIMPIIISPCHWKLKFEQIKVCPEDGCPVDTWKNKNAAWENVVSQLRELINSISPSKETSTLKASIQKAPARKVSTQKALTKKFQKFMENPGEIIHSNRDNELKLEHFYTYPTLKKTPGPTDKVDSYSQQIKGKSFIDSIVSDKKTCLVSGDSGSGKTAFCQMICRRFQKSEFFTVYIDGSKVSNDNLNQIERKSFSNAYGDLSRDEILDPEKTIIVFDNFACEDVDLECFYSLAEKMMERNYHKVIMVADYTSPLFFTPEWNYVVVGSEMDFYEIQPADGYDMRADIIRNWITASHKDEDFGDDETLAHMVRENNEFLRAIFADDVILAYPPNIILLLESRAGGKALTAKPGDDLSSYGHCYYALITHKLVQANIRPLEIGGYHNILTELAYYIYEHEIFNIKQKHIDDFSEQFKQKYMELPSKFVDKLIDAYLLTDTLLDGICMQDYALYYYVARRLSQDFDNSDSRRDVEDKIKTLFSEIHKKRNSQVMLFLVHHMPKNNYLLNNLNRELGSLFGSYKESWLTSDELTPLHRFVENLQCVANVEISDKKRKRAEITQRKREEKSDAHDNKVIERAERQEDSEEAAFLIDVSKSFRMMRIAGTLIRNGYSTMEKNTLIELSKSVRGLALRFVSMFHKQMAEDHEFFEPFLERFLIMHYGDLWHRMLPHQQKEVLRDFIGALVTHFAHNMIERSSWCIGSEKLTAELMISENNPPAYDLLNLHATMAYSKKPDIDKNSFKKIVSLHKKWKNTNIMSDRLLQAFVSDHMQIRKINVNKWHRMATALDIEIKNQNRKEFNRVTQKKIK